jgi:TPR repeat protein
MPSIAGVVFLAALLDPLWSGAQDELGEDKDLSRSVLANAEKNDLSFDRGMVVIGKVMDVHEQIEAQTVTTCPNGTLRSSWEVPASNDAAPARSCVDVAAVTVRYARSCDQGNVHDCGRFADLPLWARVGFSGKAEASRARGLYAKACARHDVSACTYLGTSYESGGSGAIDLVSAAAFYKLACVGGDLSGCSSLGALYESGSGVAPDLRRALALYQKACDGGNAAGCANLGVLYGDGRGVRRDVARAAELIGKACVAGDGHACLNLARLVSAYDAEPELAKYLYLQGCRAGDALSCANTGSFSEDPFSIWYAPARSLVAFSRACCGGDLWSCARLGDMYVFKVGVEVDKERALKFYSDGGRGGRTLACQQAAQLTVGAMPAPAGPVPLLKPSDRTGISREMKTDLLVPKLAHPTTPRPIASDDEYLAIGKRFLIQLTDASRRGRVDCDTFATEVTKVLDEDSELLTRVKAYEKAHPDAEKKVAAATQDETAALGAAAEPMFRACREHPKVRDLMTRMVDLPNH